MAAGNHCKAMLILCKSHVCHQQMLPLIALRLFAHCLRSIMLPAGLALTKRKAWVVLDPDRASLIPLRDIEDSCFCGYLQQAVDTLKIAPGLSVSCSLNARELSEIIQQRGLGLTAGKRMPATAAMAVLACTSSACWNLHGDRCCLHINCMSAIGLEPAITGALPSGWKEEAVK